MSLFEVLVQPEQFFAVNRLSDSPPRTTRIPGMKPRWLPASRLPKYTVLCATDHRYLPPTARDCLLAAHYSNGPS